MAKPNLIISTNVGAIPYIINTENSFIKKPRKVYIDDILYKDSFYDKGNRAPIREFISCTEDVYISFRNKPNTLVSKRGNYKLTAQKYEDIIKILNPTGFADFKTGALQIDEKDVLEPKDLEDFKNTIKNGSEWVGTEFVNKIGEEGKLIRISENGELETVHINDFGNEYQKYLFSINEMNSFAFIFENNYKTISEYIENFVSVK